MNLVLNLDEKMIGELSVKFDRNKMPSKNPYIRFFAKVGKTSISVYRSGKVVFQGADAAKLAAEFGAVQETKLGSEIPQENLIGTDEVGNGSYFGALVAVATFVKFDNIALLKELGVADSKKLTDEKICQIAPILQSKLAHVALTATPSRYNRAIEQGYNAVSIKVALHNQAIFLLEQKLDELPQNVVIDAFTSPANYQKYVQREKNQVRSEVTLLTKAEDQFLAVAASSVIARYLFLENLKDLSAQIGWDLPSGAGANSDRIAAQILQKNDLARLGTVAKLHFKNTQKALKLAQKN